MFKPMRTTHPMVKIMNNVLIDLPAPNNISIWWNYGSLLGLCLVMQIVTGLFLSMHYSPSIEMAFSSVCHINREVNYGWLMRAAHANGASLFFMFMYMHMGRGIYYGSFYMMETWNVGLLIFILSMATAFLGYVLPWGQMSFWGATVITNLFSAIPYMGKMLVEWIWGGFAVDAATLNRFFALHFIMPFVIVFMVVLHIMFLHQTGSNNPLGVNCDSDRVPFHSYYSIKDMLGYSMALMMFMLVVTLTPNMFTDPENFMLANPLVTPIHIKPEWYFLWLYAILRSIPNKLGGVMALFSAIIIMFTLPLMSSMLKKSLVFYPHIQLLFWGLVSSFMILTWIGGKPVEDPYILIGQTFTTLYFLYFIMTPTMMSFWKYMKL